MVNLTTNIPVAKAITSVRKWKVTVARDHDDEKVPVLVIAVQVIGNDGIDWPEPFWLRIRNGVESHVVRVNPSPTSSRDQFLLSQPIVLSGTPYTTLAAAFNGNTTEGTTAGRKKALEPLLVSVGALGPEFAGT